MDTHCVDRIDSQTVGHWSGREGLLGVGRGRQAALILGPGLIATIALPLRESCGCWGGGLTLSKTNWYRRGDARSRSP